ncbi:MAG TPA: hypothetical protein VKR59_04160 [Terriglobales bacterium]|nr:hypothetical protein [Terriglobales bacterium]
MRLTSGARLFISGLALVICGFLCPRVSGQNAPTLQEQIKAQYKLVKIGFGPSGITVTSPGTVLSVQKGGLLGVPPQAMAPCAAKFQDGTLKGPTGMCPAMMKQISRLMQVGDKVYPLKIDVSLDKDRVVFQIVECDSCNGAQQPSFFKSEVIFQFPSGSLQSTGVSKIVDTIGQVLSIDSGDDSQQQGGQGGQDQGSQDQGGQQNGNNQQGNNSNQGGNNQGGGQQAAPAPEPQQIEKGQTPEQVKAALGNPEKIVNLGAKMIYVYKDIKVTFLNGKASDVE